MLPVGIRNASTINVRITRNRTKAIRMDFAHSNAQRTVDVGAGEPAARCGAVAPSSSGRRTSSVTVTPGNPSDRPAPVAHPGSGPADGSRGRGHGCDDDASNATERRGSDVRSELVESRHVPLRLVDAGHDPSLSSVSPLHRRVPALCGSGPIEHLAHDTFHNIRLDAAAGDVDANGGTGEQR